MTSSKTLVAGDLTIILPLSFPFSPWTGGLIWCLLRLVSWTDFTTHRWLTAGFTKTTTWLSPTKRDFTRVPFQNIPSKIKSSQCLLIVTRSRNFAHSRLVLLSFTSRKFPSAIWLNGLCRSNQKTSTIM